MWWVSVQCRLDSENITSMRVEELQRLRRPKDEHVAKRVKMSEHDAEHDAMSVEGGAGDDAHTNEMDRAATTELHAIAATIDREERYIQRKSSLMALLNSTEQGVTGETGDADGAAVQGLEMIERELSIGGQQALRSSMEKILHYEDEDDVLDDDHVELRLHVIEQHEERCTNAMIDGGTAAGGAVDEEEEWDGVYDHRDVPVENWIEIFLHLSDVTRWQLAQTCKRYYSIFHHYIGFQRLVLDQAQDLWAINDVQFCDYEFHKNRIVFFSEPTASSSVVVVDARLMPGSIVDQYCIADLQRADSELDVNMRLSKVKGFRCALFFHEDEFCPAEELAPKLQPIIGHDYRADETLRIPERKLLAAIPLCGLNTKINSLHFFLKKPEYAALIKGKAEEVQTVEFRGAFRLEESHFNRYRGSAPMWRSRVMYFRQQLMYGAWQHASLSYCINVKNIRNVLSNEHAIVTAATKRALIDVVNHQFSDNDRIRVQWQQPHRSVLQRVLPAPQPDCIPVKLYDYQLRALSWMKTLEDGATRKKYRFKTLLKAPLNFGCYVPAVPGYTGTDFECVWDTERYGDKDAFSTRGGILADEMGLGKTLEMLALVLSNPRKEDADGGYTPLNRERMVYEVKTTLVICPSHIVEQWAGEVKKHCGGLRVVTIASMEEHKRLTYRDIVESDVTIVSQQFISMAKYMKLAGNVTTLQRKLAQWFDRQRGKGVAEEDLKPLPKRHALDGASPILEVLGFHRIILDEAHEILAKPDRGGHKANANKLFGKFYSNYRWFVSGTPIPFGRASLVGAMNYLQVQLESGIELPESAPKELQVFEQVVFNAMKSCLFWRTSKASVESSLKIPPLVEDLRLLRLSPHERVLYEVAEFDESKARMREVCTFPKQASFVLEEIGSVAESVSKTVKRYKSALLSNLSQVRSACAVACTMMREADGKVQALTAAIARATPAEAPGIERKLNKATTNLDSLQSQLDGLEEKIVQYASKLAILDRAPPGHPKHAANTFGTKIVHIIDYIDRIGEQDSNAKIIVFSKYEALLNTIGARSSSQCVVCHGNVKKRMAALHAFQQGSARVLLLSLTNAASGTHLTVATHIILVDPVSGGRSQAQATDSQAIARAHRLGQEKQVTVIRFIMQHTVDQCDYEDAYDTIVS